MLKRSCMVSAALCMVFTLLAAALCAADEPESIYVANTKVITIRDKGTYGSARERAVAIEKALSEIIAKQDMQHPNLSVKQADGLWTVFCGDVQIASVYPAEAEANQLPPKTLATRWMKNLAAALPKAATWRATGTPPKEGEEGPVTTKPGTTAVAKPEEGVPPPPPPIPGTPVAPVPGTPAVPATPAAPTPAAPTEPVKPAGGISAPLLLVRDSFDTIRALPEEEYQAKRDDIAGHLISDLAPFMGGKAAPATTLVTPTPSEPGFGPTAVTEPVKPTPGGGKPRVTLPRPAPPSIELPPEETTPPTGAAASKVPQKTRIREKLAKARDPFLALRNEDREAARPIEGLLRACRNSYAAGDYDKSEKYVDTALGLLGVQ